jgi:DNA-binding NarL/FixJ family response regulator
VLLAMPRALLRDAVHDSLASGHLCVTSTGDATEAAVIAERGRPHVAALALESGHHHHGFDLGLCRSVLQVSPATRVLLISDGVTANLARCSLAAGASGIFDMDHGLELLTRAVHALADGELWLSRSLVGSLIDRGPYSPEVTAVSASSLLTARELEVLRLLAEGKDHHAMAIDLFVSPHTTRTHIRNVMRKLGVHSRLEAVAVARQQSLLLDVESPTTAEG